jgi:hypothetical protein
MLRAAGDFKGLSIAAADGDIGSVSDLYFDDLTWTIRYLVVDTGTWLPGRRVLISPLSVGGAVTDKVTVNLTRAQVENSPAVEADKPVDRQQEEMLSRYYNYRYYWEGPYRRGPARLSRHAAGAGPGRRRSGRRGDDRARARERAGRPVAA